MSSKAAKKKLNKQLKKKLIKKEVINEKRELAVLPRFMPMERPLVPGMSRRLRRRLTGERGNMGQRVLEMGGQLRDMNLSRPLKFDHSLRHILNPGEYIETLMCPQARQCRVPDGNASPTFLVKSVMIIEPPCNWTGSIDDGKFSGAFQAIPGNSQQAIYYQNMIVNSAGGWPTDFTQKASFCLDDGNLNRYFPQDQYASLLFEPDLGVCALLGAGGGNTILGSAPAFNAANSFVVTVTPNLATNTNAITGLQPGTYLFTSIIGWSTASAVTTGNESDWTPIGGAVLDDMSYTVTLYLAGTVAVEFYQALVTVYSTTDGILITDVAAKVPMYSYVSFAPSVDYLAPAALTGGLTALIRPVAMSVLATCMASELTNGGEISIAVVPGDVIESHYAIQTAQANGSYNNVSYAAADPLAGLSDSYNGKLKDGAYAFWVPSGVADLEFRTPSEANDHYYPVIICSGVNSQTPAPTGNTAKPIRFIVTRVFEIQSEIPVWGLQADLGKAGHVEEALSFLAQTKHCMANAEHVNFLAKMREQLRQFLTQAAQFYSSNSSWINPAVSAGLALL
jgi:hypothetical protein